MEPQSLLGPVNGDAAFPPRSSCPAADRGAVPWPWGDSAMPRPETVAKEPAVQAVSRIVSRCAYSAAWQWLSWTPTRSSPVVRRSPPPQGAWSWCGVARRGRVPAPCPAAATIRYRRARPQVRQESCEIRQGNRRSLNTIGLSYEDYCTIAPT